MTGIVLNLTHTGATSKQIQIVDVGTLENLDQRRPGQMYLDPGETITLTYTSAVANSYHRGNIHGFIQLGYLTATFSLSPEILEATGFQTQIDALDSRVTTLESSGVPSGIGVLVGGVPVMVSATSLNFVGGVAVVDAGGGQANITISGGDSESLTGALPAGSVVTQAVYLTGGPGNDMALALATVASGAFRVVGFIQSKTTPTSGVVQTDGNLGGFSGLTPGATYYLSATTPGAITSTPPNGAGEVFKKVGVASSATVLVINLDEDYTLI